MEEDHNCGISINHQELLELESITNHGILPAQEDQAICNTGALTVDGGNSSSMKEKTSRMSKTTRSLMFQVAEMQKPKMSKFMEDITRLTKDGQSFMLETKMKPEPKD